jgi:endonuclease/exonuclease/phosphatase family metal-dependent hydrolase
MKYFIALTLLVQILFSGAANAQQLNLATYNIRYDNPGDSLDSWSHRKEVMFNMVRFYDFDIFGVQEALSNQMDDLENNLQGYAYVGNGRDDGKRKGEYSAIFYKTDRFKVLNHGMFWLSPTDLTKPNVGWDAALPRVCTWANFEDKKTGLKFFHFNTHFDHKGVQARKESARLILAKIKELAGTAPVLLTGDLNVSQENESYHLIATSGFLKDSRVHAKIKLGDNTTFNGFRDRLTNRDSRIDHIFLSDRFDVLKYGILTNSSLGHYPSDHFPVMVTVNLTR